MKYKVTTRGWVVFSFLGLFAIYSIFSLLQFFINNDSKNLTINNENEPQISQDANEGLTSNESDNSEVISDEIPAIDDEIPAIDDEKEPAIEEEISEEDEEMTESTDDNLLLSEVDTFYFDKNVATFKDAHKEILDKWRIWLQDNLSFVVVIEGHINGYPKYNDNAYGLSISNERAMVLKDYLVSTGIEPERIIVENIGSRKQVVKTDDFSQHYLNRRSVIYFKKP